MHVLLSCNLANATIFLFVTCKKIQKMLKILAFSALVALVAAKAPLHKGDGTLNDNE